MSNKLTKHKLTELIKEVLQEKTYPFDADTAIADMLGGNTSWASNKAVAGNKMRQLAKADPSGDEDDIEIIDFDNAVVGNKSQKDATAAVANHGTSTDIKKPAADALGGTSKKAKKTAKKSKAVTGAPTKINTYANRGQQRRDIRSIIGKTSLDPNDLKLNSTKLKLSAAEKITILKILIKPGLSKQVIGTRADDEPENHQDWTKAVRIWAARTLEEYVKSTDQAIKRSALLAKKSVGLKVEASSFTSGLTQFSMPLTS